MEDASNVFKFWVLKKTYNFIVSKAEETGMPPEDIAGQMMETGSDVYLAETLACTKVSGYIRTLKEIRELASPARKAFQRLLFPEKPVGGLFEELPIAEMFPDHPELKRPFKHLRPLVKDGDDRGLVDVNVTENLLEEIEELVQSHLFDKEAYATFVNYIDLMALDSGMFLVDLRTLQSFRDRLQDLISCSPKLCSDSKESLTAIVNEVDTKMIPLYRLLVEGDYSKATELVKDWIMPIQVVEMDDGTYCATVGMDQTIAPHCNETVMKAAL